MSLWLTTAVFAFVSSISSANDRKIYCPTPIWFSNTDWLSNDVLFNNRSHCTDNCKYTIYKFDKSTHIFYSQNWL